ncbi:MAG: beta-hydroxyacyl-ACP dehydratase [Paludibacteraceae bacterium]|nr:beta-hydroxyacyl-ACP dehydratase [Paludibacteraceae bacterium]
MISDYYSIEQLDKLSGVARVRLNRDSAVYKGHFPDNPVSPGVCNIEMIREVAETVHGGRLRIRRIKQCRFTTLITPLIHRELEVRVMLQEQEQGHYRLTGTLGEGEAVYMSLKADMTDE